MKQILARIFRRIRQEGDFFNLLKCNCGSTRWEKKHCEFTVIFTCKQCGESHILIKKPRSRYGFTA